MNTLNGEIGGVLSIEQNWTEVLVVWVEDF